MRVEGEGGSVGPELVEIDVDLLSLKDFETLMRREVESNLRPYGERIIRDHGHGACFGALSASAQVQDARHFYQACLVQSVETMRSYIEVSEALVAAVQRVAANYAGADALAEERADKVAGELMAAMGQARLEQEQAQQRAEAALAQQELQRRVELFERWDAV
jgi:hypothetical protein